MRFRLTGRNRGMLDIVPTSLIISKQKRMLDTCQFTNMFIVHTKVSAEGGALLEFTLEKYKR